MTNMKTIHYLIIALGAFALAFIITAIVVNIMFNGFAFDWSQFN